MGKLEIELNQSQLERIGELHNAVYDLCVLFAENPDLARDTHHIGEIADRIADALRECGERVHYLTVVHDGNDDRTIEWEE